MLIEKASKDGDLFILIKRSAEIRANRRINIKVLNLAAQYGHIKIIRAFYLKDIQKLQYLAAENGYLDLLKFLIEERKEKIKKNILAEASANGHLDIVKYLIGKVPGQPFQDCVVLASKNGHVEILKYILDMSGISPSIESINYSAMNGHVEIVKYLFDYTGATPETFEFAVWSGNTEIVDFLVYKGVECDKKTICQYPVLMNNLEMLKYLNNLGYPIFQDALLLCSCSVYGDLKMFEYIIEQGSDVDMECFYSAVNTNHKDIVIYLLEEFDLEFEPEFIMVNKLSKDILYILVKIYKDSFKDRSREVIEYCIENNDTKTFNIIKDYINYENEIHHYVELSKKCKSILLEKLEKIQKEKTEKIKGLCPICYIDKKDYKVKTPCNHYFHYKCLYSWLKTKNTCPMCREKINE